MFGPVHHVGLVTRDLARAQSHFASLGYTPTGPCALDERQGVEIVFLKRDAAVSSQEPLIELISPTSSTSAVYGFTTRNEYPIHHLCFSTGDIAVAVRRARELRYYIVQEPIQAPAIAGSLIAFCYSRATGLIEFVEQPPF